MIVVGLVFTGLMSPDAAAKDTRRVVYVRNESTIISNTAIRRALPAFQDAVVKDFAPVWDVNVRLVFIGRNMPAKSAWRITIQNSPACIGCYGYHEYVDGIVRGFVGTDTFSGNWQVTFTHELFEIMVDPYVSPDGAGVRGVLVGTDWYVQETADPVEAERFAYLRRGIKISDFVTPEWFDATSDGPWDFKRHTTRPLQILFGGYQIVWRAGTWVWLDPSGLAHTGPTP